MGAINEDYVSFETAKLLKEKGFNEYCMAFRSPSGALFRSSHDIKNFEDGKTIGGAIAAPTLQMAIKWLREVCKLHIEPHIQTYKNYNGNIYNLDGELLLGFPGESPEQACEAAIKYCIKYLIK